MDIVGIAAATAVVLYLVSYWLAHMKMLHVAMHRKIWNAVLALSFIGVVLTALALAFKVMLPFSVLPIHMTCGAVFIVVAIFHALWHLPYFKSYLPSGKKAE
jgi:hypothetical protein